MFNHKARLPGADESVRKALVQALTLSELAQVVSSGNGKPATGLVAPGISPCKQNTVGDRLPKNDADAAGWKAGDGGKRQKAGQQLTITIAYPSSRGPARRPAPSWRRRSGPASAPR